MTFGMILVPTNVGRVFIEYFNVMHARTNPNNTGCALQLPNVQF